MTEDIINAIIAGIGSDDDPTQQALAIVDNLGRHGYVIAAQQDGGWRPVDTAPHETYVLLGWWDEGKWNCTTGLASHGWRRNGISTMSWHGQATHWRPLPAGPEQGTSK